MQKSATNVVVSIASSIECINRPFPLKPSSGHFTDFPSPERKTSMLARLSNPIWSQISLSHRRLVLVIHKTEVNLIISNIWLTLLTSRDTRALIIILGKNVFGLALDTNGILICRRTHNRKTNYIFLSE